IAVKRDIPLGELMDLFESAAHSRLVVYNESLDDPEGMVHIRDLLAFMTARARVSATTKTKRRKPPPAGLDLRAVDLALPLSEARASLDDVRSVIGNDFVTGEAGEEVQTLGGYLVSHVGRLPVRGEVISGPGNFEIEVLDADPRRVKRLRIATRKERQAPRTQRENRRREAPPEAGQTPGSDSPSPPATDGAGP